MSGRSLDTGTNREINIRHQIDGNVSHAGFEHRVGPFAARGNEFRHDRTRPGLHMCGRNTPQLNAATTGFGLYRAASGAEFNTAAAGFSSHIAVDVSEFDCSACSFGLEFAGALIHVNRACPGLEGCALRGGNEHKISAAAFRDYSPLGRANVDGPASGAQTEIASDIADVNRSSPGFRVHCAADIVEMNSAATTLRFQSAGNASGHNIAAFGFDLH